MCGIGMPELILILVVALVVIGPKKLPDLARALGKGMAELKKATQDVKDSLEVDESLREVKRDLADTISGFDNPLDLLGTTKGEDIKKAEEAHDKTNEQSLPLPEPQVKPPETEAKKDGRG